jgi:hypothetical protein
MSKLDTLTYLTQHGFHLFPLVANGKQPAFDGWQDWATQDINKVTAYHNKMPQANWGISTARYKADQHLCVVDVDVKKGKPGLESLDKLQLLNGELPATLTTVTATGGRHLFFTSETPVRNSAGTALGAGLDSRGEGGYVVAPGSAIDGALYELANEAIPQPAPAWLVTRIGPPRAKEDKPAIEAFDNSQDADRAVAYLKEKAPLAVQGAGGDETTYKVAARVKDFGIAEETALSLMLQHWNENCSPPWDPAELKAKISNAYSYGTLAAGTRSTEAAGFEPVMPDAPKGFPANAFAVTTSVLTDTENMPPRRFILGSILLGGYVTLLVAPGGVGKSASTISWGLAIALGRDDIAGMKVHEQGNVLIVNNEDDITEIDRRIYGAVQYFDVGKEANGKVFRYSGLNERFKIAKRTPDKILILSQMAKELAAFIHANQIKAVFVDPLVSTHDGNENDNGEMDEVMGFYKKLAQNTEAAICIVHHSRKPSGTSSAGYAGDADAARGASASVNASRVSVSLYDMTEDEAKEYGVADSERNRYVRLDDAKMNYDLKSAHARWFFKETVRLGNGDNVGVLRPASLTKRHVLESDALAKAVKIYLEKSLKGEGLLSEVVQSILDGESAMFGDPDAKDGGATAVRRKLIALFRDKRKVDGWAIWYFEDDRPGINGKHWLCGHIDA